MIEASKPRVSETAPATPTAPGSAGGTSTGIADSDSALAAEPLAPTCTIDDFTKVDLRVARVIAAEDVPKRRSCSSSR